MRSIAWMGAGVVAGAVGAAVWTAVVYYSGWEIGWIAWGMGVLVGIAVMAAARDEVGTGTAIGAACIAAASVLGGKYAVTQLEFNDFWASETGAALGEGYAADEETLVSWLAGQLIEEREAAGEVLEWPDYDEDDPDVPIEDTYPEGIWADAQARWDNADEAYKAQHREYVETTTVSMIDEFKGAIVQEGFLASFSLWDMLWLGLAVVSAWRIGGGMAGADD